MRNLGSITSSSKRQTSPSSKLLSRTNLFQLTPEESRFVYNKVRDNPLPLLTLILKNDGVAITRKMCCCKVGWNIMHKTTENTFARATRKQRNTSPMINR